MTLETFFEKFDIFADAPNAVEKMRELVLQLAVQGKLVDQSEDDEPAEALLKHIRSSRAKRAGKGQLKTRVEIPPVESADEPFAIPESWVWVPLNEISELVYGKLLPTSELLPEGFDVFGANGVIGNSPSITTRMKCFSFLAEVLTAERQISRRQIAT